MYTANLLAILFTHWVSDFLMQTRWQADNKSKNLWALTSHVLNYAIGFFLLLGTWLMVMKPTENTFYCVVGYVFINAVFHWITDFFTSKATSYLWRQKDVHGFFCMIGFDQFVHAFCLIVTYNLVF